MIRKLYPGGKRKAFNISYDDGVLQDVRFVELLNQYGLKGTINLNSELMEREFSWVHPCGLEIKRLPGAAVRHLYDGHEIASHTLTHPYMHNLSEKEILHQLGADRWNLEQHFGREVKGFAVPFDYYSDLIAGCAERLGFEYARMSEFTGGYTPGHDYYHWKAGFYHILPGLTEYADGFLHTDEELALCQIVGHSYDLDTENLWETMEAILRKISGDPDVWPATNLELVRYLKAMDRAAVSEDHVCNHSDRDLWFEVDGTVRMLCPGQTIYAKRSRAYFGPRIV